MRWRHPLAALLAALCLLALSACGDPSAPAESTEQTSPAETTEPAPPADTPEPSDDPAPAEDPSLTQFRETLAEGGYFCGLAFLGYLPEGDPAGLEELLQAGGYGEDYPFLADLSQDQVVAYEGDEVYCLVPRDPAASLTVQAWNSTPENQYQGEVGETLYTDDQGRPVVLIGNVSDVIPNLQVTLTGEDGTELLWHPALGLCDSTLALPATPKVYDFSRYDTLELPQQAADFLGTWAAEGASLTLREDGSAAYTTPTGEAFTGTYYVITTSSQYPEGSVLLELSAEGNTPDFWGIFTFAPEGSTLTAASVTGDRLLDRESVTFTAAE